MTEASPRIAWAAAVLGCLALAARPALVRATPDATALLVLLFLALAAAGAAWRAPAVRAAGPWLPLAVGVSAVVVAGILGGGRPALPATGFAVATNTLAAVAEELFFRRLLYGLLERHGTAVAMAGSAAAFAIVHVTAYGFWVLPLDLLAGLLLSWQRAETGSWRAPALTHVVANLVAVL